MDSALLSYYQAQLSSSPSAIAAANASASSATSGSASTTATPPWDELPPSKVIADSKVLSTTDIINTSNVPLSGGSTSNSKTAQDNQKLFSLYNAVNSLATLAQMAQSSTATTGQLAGYNTRFQQGLSQLQSYLSATSFNNFTLEAAKPSSSVNSTASVPNASFTYSTNQFIANSAINSPVPGLSSSDSFTIAVTKNGTTTDLPIDLSQVQGSLTLGNIVSYINSQLSQNGFQTRFQVSESGQTATSSAAATYGLNITPGANETISLSAPTPSPALYLVGSTGSSVATTNEVGTTSTSSPADEQGTLKKLSLTGGTAQPVFSVAQDAQSGTTNAVATAVDSSGNVYVIGDATGNIGNNINQGSQDVYLTKYDSAGNVVWSELLGSAGSASGYGLATDPAGGVVVTGTSSADLTSTSIGTGNNDSFVASYDSNGNQLWVQQIPTLATNQANAVSVDSSGNIYIGGQVSGGVIGAGQTNQGGTSNGYLAEFSSSGTLLAENQFGSTGANSVAATAIGSDGSVYVGSVQNGQAIISKYAPGAISSAPVWQENLGTLSAGGAISGLSVSGNQIYVSGTTTNANLTAGGAATIANPSTSGTNAFVFNLTDNGSSASADYVSYVGNNATTQGGALTIGPDGTVYLAGTTQGTFSGQSRSVASVNNAFVAAIGAGGTVDWTQQFGGSDGQSTGSGIAIDPQGSSILDALGLPSGQVQINQTVDLSQTTTLQAGDSFQIKIDGPVPRTATITIGQGETLNSLITKINGELSNAGKASMHYSNNAEGLTIAADPGHTIELIAGPTDFDALSRLGIQAGTLSAPATGSKSSSSTSSASSSGQNSATTPTYGLGLTGSMDISTTMGATLARSQLLGVMSAIQSTYQTTNTPPSKPTAATGQSSNNAPVSAYQSAQLASYNTALALLNSGSTTNTSTSAASNGISPSQAAQLTGYNAALALLQSGSSNTDATDASSTDNILSLFQ